MTISDSLVTLEPAEQRCYNLLLNGLVKDADRLKSDQVRAPY